MKDKVAEEPVMAVAVLLAVVLAAIGIHIDAGALAQILFAVLPLLAGVVARLHVKPMSKVKSGA